MNRIRLPLVLGIGMWSIAAALPAICSIENVEHAVAGRLSRSSHDTWTWQARPGDRVRCDLPGYEPLDVSCPASSCTPGARTLQPSIGRPVEIRGLGAETAEVRVEWRRFGLWGEATQPVAVRRIGAVAADPPVVYVARGEDRLLRLRHEGSAPRTFYLPAPEPPSHPPAGSELEPAVLQVHGSAEGSARGGELFGFVEAPDFRPLGLRLEGPESAELGLDAYGMFAHSPLRAGLYRLYAWFRGGVELAGPTVRVASGETTELVPWQLPPVGALELELDPELCDAMAAASPLLELEGRGGAVLRLHPEADRCHFLFEGLAPGGWSLTLRGVGEPASAAVALEAGRSTAVTLARPRTWLEGVVLAGGEPLAELELRASSAGSGPEEVEAVSAYTDSEGRYRLELPSSIFAVPGPIVLELLSSRGFPITSRDVELVKGTNVQSFDLGEGRIEVRVERADGGALDGGELAGGVTIEVWREGTLVRTGKLAEGEEATLIYDLGYGRYELSAFAAGGWATASREPAELDKDRPRESVELVLEQIRAVATVLDATGSPIPGLLVAIDQRQIAESPDRPGEYPLLGASAGSELRIVPPPGHVPACRMLERVESFDVVLLPATAEALLIPPPGGLPPAGSFLGLIEGLPGSNCAMPVSLIWQPVVDAEGRELVRLQGLRPGTFRFRSGEGVVVLQVPGPPTPMPGAEP